MLGLAGHQLSWKPVNARFSELRDKVESHVLQDLDIGALARGIEEMQKGQTHRQESQDRVRNCTL